MVVISEGGSGQRAGCLKSGYPPEQQAGPFLRKGAAEHHRDPEKWVRNMQKCFLEKFRAHCLTSSGYARWNFPEQ